MEIFNHNSLSKWPLKDKSVQSVITSPPYWQLRKYSIPDIQIAGWKGQYGMESDFQRFIRNTLRWVDEAWRVLKNDGLLFINLQDTYVSGDLGSQYFDRLRSKTKYPAKTKLLIPQRIAIAMVDSGWILRNDIIWHKVNGNPESVKDRFTNAHEYIFMFSKQEKYFFDLDSVRIKTDNQMSIEEHNSKNRWGKQGYSKEKGVTFTSKSKKKSHYLGKTPRNVWSIPSQATKHEHYASFPEKLVKRMVLCSSRRGDVVLDPFCGSGTTIKVAEENNREGIGFDLGYKEIQKARLGTIQRQLM